jgi:phage head maturation protease
MTKQMSLPDVGEEQAAGPQLADMIRAVPRSVEVAKSAAGYTFRGVASTIGEVDRMKRCFLPGAFGRAKVKVPLLAFHDDTRPIGRSSMEPKGSTLLHESLIPNAARHDDIVELIEAGGIPATSVGWLTPEEDRYYGWSQLERRNPDLARKATAAGVPQRDDVTYYASAEFVENSVVPIPAHRGALIAVASLMGAERGMVEELLELAAGARHSSSDQAAIQRAHDALVEAGATCAADREDTTSLPAGAPGSATEPADRTGITGGWGDSMRSSFRRPLAAPSVASLVQTLDDAIDTAQGALGQGDTEGAQAAIQTADTAVDELAAALNLTDADEDEQARLQRIERAAQWTGAYINDLPDSSFLYIEDGGKKDSEGKTTPRSLRHFPYKDSEGKVDLPHLRNALGRIPQSSLPDSVKSDVLAKAQRIAKDNGIDTENSAAPPSDAELAELERELAGLAAGS